uniref:Uncharacterized protein n=1 Tax=Salix viminalis TaxID=40686 RepID=A0A6N2KWB6_SALVM
MGCLAFGSREFSFLHTSKILNLFVIRHQHQFGFKRSYLSWNHSVISVPEIQVSKIFLFGVENKLLIK